MPRILISDPLSQSGLDRLEQEAGLELDIRRGLEGDELRAALATVDGVIIRSGTQLTAEVLEGQPRLTYDQAFERALGTTVLDLPTGELVGLARRKVSKIPEGIETDDRDGWLNLLLAEVVEPTMGQAIPEFLFDYPSSQAALATIRAGSPPVAERFELYVTGIEVCNGYQELTDADELVERTSWQSGKRHRRGQRSLPVSSRLEQAQRVGLPDCAGVALGWDRLVMLVLGAGRLEEVMAFPFPRA